MRGESFDRGGQDGPPTEGDTAGARAPLLSVDQASVVYPNGTVALQETSIGFADGELTVLLGPSGAGKSTLLRTLNLLVLPSTGAIKSRNLGALSETSNIRAHRRDTAMIFQQHQLIGRMSALHNVLMSRLGQHSFWRTLFGFSEEERRLALACLERVGLFDKALTRCDSLSGGQQQRVGIARALAQEPKLILADEPVASLDPASSKRVLNVLRRISIEDEIPAIISLHQLDYAKEFADRIVGLAGGKIVFDGPPRELTDDTLTRIYGATGQDPT